MRRVNHVLLVFCMLGIASLGCTLGSAPTAQPLQPVSLAPVSTATVVLQVGTSVLTTATAQPQSALPANNTATCTVRSDWQLYSVVSGDTLGELASRTGTTLAELVQANCLANANSISVGQQLRVPRTPGPRSATQSAPAPSTQDVFAPSMGSMSIRPARPDPAHAGAFIVITGSTVTLRIDNLRNITSVRFVIPPDGWIGNGFSKTDPQPVISGVSEYTLSVPVNKGGVQFNFTAEGLGVDGRQVVSAPMLVSFSDEGFPPSFDGLDAIPSTPSGTSPQFYTVKAGTTITLHAHGLVNAVSAQFILPPAGWSGNGSITTSAITVTGSSVDYQYAIPADAAGKEFEFTVVLISSAGKPTMGSVHLVVVN